MTNQIDTSKSTHRRAVRFFWCFLIGATLVSLWGMWCTRSCRTFHIVIQIGAAAAPPIGLLAAVHGIALAVRAGASGRVYCWAVGAVAVIGAGAFALSFLALRDLMLVIGYSSATAWIFPAIVDTAVAVSTLMLVALGDKPARRSRAVATSGNTQTPATQRLSQSQTQSAKDQVRAFAPGGGRGKTVEAKRVPTAASVQPDLAQTVAGLSASPGDTGRCRNCTG
jgi:hypothetical protein